MNRLAIVTATIDLPRALTCITSWLGRATRGIDLYTVRQTVRQADWERTPWFSGNDVHGDHRIYLYDSREILGVVPAFNIGVAQALKDGHQIIACFHDDLEIEEEAWDDPVVNLFKACPRAGLLGFGGAKGLADDDIYRTPYRPMQLVRKQFLSNMRHAEAHGARCEVACPVACLDGFSQIGLANYWRCIAHPLHRSTDASDKPAMGLNLFTSLELAGIVHHAYDAALGAFAKQLGYQVWFLPIKVHHHGGLTAVADPRYLNWAIDNAAIDVQDDGYTQTLRGDAAFWHKSHRAVYEMFRGVLPIRVS